MSLELTFTFCNIIKKTWITIFRTNYDFLELIMRGTKIKTKLKDSVGFEPLDKVGVKLIQ